MSVFD